MPHTSGQQPQGPGLRAQAVFMSAIGIRASRSTTIKCRLAGRLGDQHREQVNGGSEHGSGRHYQGTARQAPPHITSEQQANQQQLNRFPQQRTTTAKGKGAAIGMTASATPLSHYALG
jgi:hypothetical protein